MSDATADDTGGDDGARKRGSRRVLLTGVLATVVFGAGGFAASYAGLIRLPGSGAATVAGREAVRTDFVPVGTIVVSMGSGGRHLRVGVELEVVPAEAAEVTRLIPRVRDVLNGYLRAVEPAVFDRPEALTILRAQMLRRVQMVLGTDAVRDFLVTEFVFG